MAYTIAIAGKGGTGKTTFSAMLIKELMGKSDKPVLAVDADPNTNLHEVLGLDLPGTIGDIREETIEKIDKLPSGMTKAQFIQYSIRENMVESPGLDLIAMGRPEGPGCYCFVNNLLRTFLDSLSRDYSFIVIDNEAGLEHLSRRTTRNVDLLLAVSVPNLVALRSAYRIQEMTKSLKLQVKDSYLVINRANGSLSSEFLEEMNQGNLSLAGRIPDDPIVEEYGLSGKSVLSLPDDSLFLKAVREMLNNIHLPI
ncbi:MAG: AAA family ATPase [Candidatus Tectomicrobia bacterium]|uniref:AAA family ATPase n=1 Tax=Tectimicrobiota bacterium TaxID=2528274 RepID=A0A933LQJ3_UNCTE|nr:AAA family ATPase [Candidatus Tectomicrobia bacterium]